MLGEGEVWWVSIVLGVLTLAGVIWQAWLNYRGRIVTEEIRSDSHDTNEAINNVPKGYPKLYDLVLEIKAQVSRLEGRFDEFVKHDHDQDRRTERIEDRIDRHERDGHDAHHD